MSDDPGREMVKSICREVADLDRTDEIDAISVVIVYPDGTLRTLSAYREGTKLPLVAGMAIAQQDFIGGNCPPERDVPVVNVANRPPPETER
jgi:hypothetical protein